LMKGKQSDAILLNWYSTIRYPFLMLYFRCMLVKLWFREEHSQIRHDREM
jgi:hypothetical protein